MRSPSSSAETPCRRAPGTAAATRCTALSSAAARPHVVDLAAGLVMLAFGAWLVPRTIGLHSGLAERNSELVSRVRRLTVTRVDAVDTAAAELRRVERDLHDGAQARLVALGISLRATERLIRTDPDAAVALVAESRENSARALAELRALVRGINPPGAGRTRPRRRHPGAGAGLPGGHHGRNRPARARAGAGGGGRVLRGRRGARQRRQARRRAQRAHPGRPRVPGCCGSRSATTARAAPTRRAAPGCAAWNAGWAHSTAMLAISSPPGGPTIVVIEVPCALSSPKTSSC